MNPGTIVRLRDRYWVLLPHEDETVYWLRPLTGTSDEALAVRRDLVELLGQALPSERLEAAIFPPPTAADVTDAAGARLLWHAARLTLREGASPLRCLGRISIRPRNYQFVPLIMALRLDPLRLFIADDVGVGKTIEALLIARELWERGQVRRLAVLCPPYLCDQWQAELAEKFNLEPVVIRSGTIGALERHKPISKTIYEYYPVQVASIDYLKSDRNRHAFLLHAPELLIVDEVHGAADSPFVGQQQRHRLLRDLASDRRRHLVLLTATPHSGIETAFRSLLALLDPEFAAWPLDQLDHAQVARLSRHFVQRTRRDIVSHWKAAGCFPERLAEDRTYALSPAYRRLFGATYAFCAEIVRSGEQLTRAQRRVRYWGALSLLRCVMSSPAAAEVALAKREWRLAVQAAAEEEDAAALAAAPEDETATELVPEGEPAEGEADFAGYVFESSDDRTEDEAPTPPIEQVEATLARRDQARLRELGRLAEELRASADDTKLAGLVELVKELQSQGWQPIIWCRFVATAEYVAEALRQATAASDTQVVCVTGRQPEEERRARIAEIDATRPRILVATDCLSEGINLQEKFNAVVHYDLPWNPNRLEQREGRVDRYGQTAPQVKAICYYGRDNPVDGVVLKVLLRKAREIQRALGTAVPVPLDSESVMEAVLKALLLASYRTADGQLRLDFGLPPEVEELHRLWEAYAERERLQRTRFRAEWVDPEVVAEEVAAADAVLGDPDEVRRFVLDAAQRLGLPIRRLKADHGAEIFGVAVSPEARASLPEAVAFALPARKDNAWRISFDSPTPEGAEYVGRNHRFVAALARYLLEEALTRPGKATASRAGAIATSRVAERTVLLLLRVRYLIERPGSTPWFAEEVRVLGYRGGHDDWLPSAEALELLAEARPDANLPLATKQALVQATLDEWPERSSGVRQHLEARAEELTSAHRRILSGGSNGRAPSELVVRAQGPADLVAVLVLVPLSSATQGGRR